MDEPREDAPETAARAQQRGAEPVCASVDGRAWNTSVWRDRRHGCVLAVPARLRRGRAEGDVVTVTLTGRVDS